MPMFEWSSDRFASYSEGYIIVCAANVESARKKAIKEYKRRYTCEYSGLNEGDFKKFLEDIESEPSVDDVLFHYGSD